MRAADPFWPMKSFVVRKNISIKATPDKVWDALTNPEKTRKYFFHCRIESDWKVGSSITFRGRMLLLIKLELKGKIIQIEPEKYLKYTLQNASDEHGSFSTVIFDLNYTNGVTIVNVTDDVGQGPDSEKRYKRSEKAWDKVLSGMKKLVEEETSLNATGRA